MNRRQIFIMAGGVAAFLAAAGMGVPAFAAKDGVYTGLVKGVAVGGYDPVAYFTEKKPVKGSTEFSDQHDGATWRFASEANRDVFLANPNRYAPQFGGYCAWAVANGYTAKGDPKAWSVVDGRLYLNYSTGVRQKWSQDIPGNISSGNANWPGVLD